MTRTPGTELDRSDDADDEHEEPAPEEIEMEQTTNRQYPYPTLTDPFTPSAYIQALAEAVDVDVQSLSETVESGGLLRVALWDGDGYDDTPIAPTAYIGPEEPTSPTDGDIWLETE